MSLSDRHAPTAKAIGLALLIPLAVSGLVVLLLSRAGPHDVVPTGVPKDHLGPLRAAALNEASISRDEAVDVARDDASDRSAGVREVRLGRYPDDALDVSLRGRLVWAVSLVADESAPVFISGPFNRDRSCDWAWHYGYVLVKVDADTGQVLSSGSGAFFDPSLPPTYDRPGNSDQTYCERLLAQDREAASSP